MVGAEGSQGSSPKPQTPSPSAAVETSPQPPVKAQAAAAAATPVPAATNGGNGQHSIDELRRIKSSPLVRKIAAEHGVDITRIPGSGLSGRVTKQDILSFIETGAALRPQDLLVKGAVGRQQSAVSHQKA